MIIPLNGDDKIQGAPKSYWTKTRIIEYARAARCKPDAIDALKKFNLDDLRAIVLVPTGWYACGSSKIPGAIRRTKYYRVDISFINSLGGGCFD